MSLTYTNIQHDFRKENNLSLTEYIICDTIYFLATNPLSKVPGWCYMSRGKMAEEMGISKRQLQNLIQKLEGENWLIRDQVTNFLKPSLLWSKVYFKGGEIIAPPVQKCHEGGEIIARDGGEIIAPYNNRLDNNREKNESENSICVSLLDESEKTFSEAGLHGQFFHKMKEAHSLTDLQLKNSFLAWKKKQENLQTIFRQKQHLKNSFNRFLTESKSGGGKQEMAPKVVSGGRMI